MVDDKGGGWPQIGDIINNHDGGRPDPVGDLAGAVHDLTFADGGTMHLHFQSADRLDWTVSGREPVSAQPYQAFRMREGKYFVDFVDATDRHVSFSIWLDFETKAAFLVKGSVADRTLDRENLLTRIERSGSQSVPKLLFRPGSIGREGGDRCPRTNTLLGKYLRYVYSDTHTYDHYYVSTRYYYWYCWKGPDAGIGELDEADYFDLGDGLYLVCWTEKLLPCLAVTIEDHRSMTTIGKIFGADSHTWETGNNTVGAKMTLIATIPVVDG